MAVKERSQIKGTDAQIKSFAGHNGVLAFATDTKSLHVLSGTAGTTTEFLPSNKFATVATSGNYNDLNNAPVVDSTLSSTSENPVQNKVINSALDGKLSLTGGTITGTLKIKTRAGTLRLETYGATGSTTTNSGAHIATIENDSYLEVHPSHPGMGATLFMASSEYSGSALNPGDFLLRSMSVDKTANYDLWGTNTGSLTWCGHNVITVVSESYGDNSWYRKYSDGWIEQGGNATFPVEGFLDVTLPIAFNNNHYTINFCSNSGIATWLAAYTTTTFTLARENTYTIAVWWYACGK